MIECCNDCFSVAIDFYENRLLCVPSICSTLIMYVPFYQFDKLLCFIYFWFCRL